MVNKKHIQSVLLSKQHFDKKSADEFINRHKFKLSLQGKGVHETENYYRYRQIDPKHFTSFYSEQISPSVIYIIGSS